MKADSYTLLSQIVRAEECGERGQRDWVAWLQSSHGTHPKRTLRLLEKWYRRGWLEWGTTIRRAWMTCNGLEKAKAALETHVREVARAMNRAHWSRISESEQEVMAASAMATKKMAEAAIAKKIKQTLSRFYNIGGCARDPH